MKKFLCIIIACCFTFMLTSCDDKIYPSEYPVSAAYTMNDLMLPLASETDVIEDVQHRVRIDYSNVSSGYIRVKRLIDDGRKMKVKVLKNGITYPAGHAEPRYDMDTLNKYETFPLPNGDGEYRIRIMLQTDTLKYMEILELKLSVDIQDEQAVFLYPNQIVDYEMENEAIAFSFALCAEDNNDLQRVKTIYDYIVKHISYDDEKVEATKDNYALPVLDEILATKKGVCFDYAALFAAMCRAQHIPCKVIVGDTTIAYHAWVEVWLEEKGWIDPSTLFEAKEWTRLDPTFASTKADYDDEYITVYMY